MDTLWFLQFRIVLWEFKIFNQKPSKNLLGFLLYCPIILVLFIILLCYIAFGRILPLEYLLIFVVILFCFYLLLFYFLFCFIIESLYTLLFSVRRYSVSGAT